MTTFNLHELGERAAAVIDERGWTHGTMFDYTGRVCAVGAMWLAAGWTEKDALEDVGDHDPAIYVWDKRVLAPALGLAFPEEFGKYGVMWSWNDRHLTTIDVNAAGTEVARKLRNLPDVDVDL